MTFSIIIPVYNVAPYLRACLDSVLAQTYSDWEAICVDDGSTDGSGAILDEYAAIEDRIKIVHQKNTGVSSARNTGLSMACGEWVFFLDGDDVVAPVAFEKLAKIISDCPSENLIRFGLQNFDDGFAYPSVQNRKNSYRTIDISTQIAYENYYVYVCQFLFRRTLIADMKFERYKRGEDRLFIVRILCFKVNSFVATDDVVYFYRQRMGSAVHSRASVQVMKDELSHRVDIIEAIDSCGKRMPYAGTAWLEKYCLCGYLNCVEKFGGYNREERTELLKWFYRQLPRIQQANGYSVEGRLYAFLHGVAKGKFGRYLIRWFIPLWTHRVKNMLSMILFSPSKKAA